MPPYCVFTLLHFYQGTMFDKLYVLNSVLQTRDYERAEVEAGVDVNK